MPYEAGERLGKYEIQGYIGGGGMADVYRAWDPLLSRPVAIKVLKAEQSRDPSFVEAFLQEARTAARLSHPRVITIHDVGQEDGVDYIVMEYAAGQNLQELIQEQGALPPELVCELFDQVADALNYAHRQGFVHCDVKPSNILLDAEGWVKLSDFGIARAVTQAQEEQSKRIGSPRYMSPEHVLDKHLDHRSDIYSLGVVLFEMLTGRVPFAGETSRAVMQAHVMQRPPLPSSVKPELSKQVDKVVLRALAKNPQARHQNALQMARELRKALAPGTATGLSLPEAPAQRIASAPARRRPWVVLGLVGGAAAVLIAAGAAGGLFNPTPTVTATATVRPTFSALPTATATAMPRTVEILLPTATSTPRPAATSTLAPTDTPLTPTATPTQPTRSPTPSGPVYAAPALLEPAEGAGIHGETIPLRWEWAGTLKDDEWFDLWVWPHGGAERQHQLLKSSGVDIYPPGGVGVYHWKVRIVRRGPGDALSESSPFSPSRSFDYKGQPVTQPTQPPTRPVATVPPKPTREPNPLPTRN